jgi:hypothetical protein
MKRPIGYFVHHQGRGHAVRCAAIASALQADREIVIFSARSDIFPALPPQARIVAIPSLFERGGDEALGMDGYPTPSTLHCAPLGWPGIRHAMATMANWFAEANPALMVSDVSAEIAQFARICSVPHVCVLQHGNRGDPAHSAGYEGAVGLLAPFHAALAQPEWPDAMRAKLCFAAGLGAVSAPVKRREARRRTGLPEGERVILVVAGSSLATAAIGVGARTFPEARWVVIGRATRDWHATEPANVDHRGWVENASDYIDGADLVISATGNTTCQQVLAAGRPWLAIPEWRYFDEQHRKAERLAAAGAATVRLHAPSSAGDWIAAIEEARARHDPAAQAGLVESDPAARAAGWLEALADDLWRQPSAADSRRQVA